MAKDKRDRRVGLPGALTKQRFEQEVAEEIGISLDRRGGKASRRARTAASSPGTQGVVPEPRDTDERQR